MPTATTNVSCFPPKSHKTPDLDAASGKGFASSLGGISEFNLLQVYRLAEKYFGKWNPKFEPLQSTETLAQASVKPLESVPAFEKTSVAGPILVKGFYRGDVNSDESFMMDVIECVFTSSCHLQRSAHTQK